ncbi:hypothetical protein AWRI1631_153880 [Saccharomyces cerevisiae AWRI1631]|uniref:Uncharacterized protein n=1 Tax=Saccharomyces cerevisiae (strain AWRI1631) TaxID=545124 RepID=B5VSC1_YEAS6|nr:hypothetical protein AWRI1631_153880 [Saccharomyces cerevisiae AWRI1631]
MALQVPRLLRIRRKKTKKKTRRREMEMLTPTLMSTTAPKPVKMMIQPATPRHQQPPPFKK